MILTSSLFLTLVPKLAGLSSNQAGFTSTDYYNIANLLLEKATKEVLKTREEYLMFTDSIPIVANQDTYRIPYRSVDGRIRHFWYQAADGSRTQLNSGFFENIETYGTTDRSTPSNIYIEGNNIVFLPPPQATVGNLLVAYPFRPSQFVDSTTTTVVSAVNYNTNTITVSNVPSNFTSGALYDVVEHRSGNNILYYDQVGTITGSTITFPTAIPNIIVGNLVSQAGQCSVPMLPECVHTLLLEMVICRIEEIRGNETRVKNSTQRMTEELDTCRSLLSSRVISKPPAAGGGNPLLPQRLQF